MLRKVPALSISLLLAFPFWNTSIAAASCVMHAPEDVLSCLESTMASRDLATLQDLLAPDFTFHFGTTHSWGRDDEIAANSKMFENPKVEQIELRISDPIVVPGSEPGTWWLEDVDTDLFVRVLDDQGISHEYSVKHEDMRFGIRATKAALGFQIFSWQTIAE